MYVLFSVNKDVLQRVDEFARHLLFVYFLLNLSVFWLTLFQYFSKRGGEGGAGASPAAVTKVKCEVLHGEPSIVFDGASMHREPLS